ncbi:endonuclease MutS2 [Vallitalea pronyensis]|uniref:Endonuclease MutS2 n=1 Tax=Vallitalea pronyensis TaxID=1348613 RepID=A0A8J8SH76_9FIRM|nr:hypothetical protein [Vallitalea pronyensis]QUI23144.1 endonuclease MutS2 [Vallitalea pronyensis]
MNVKALEQLEYYKIKEALKACVVSELGKELVEELQPSNDAERIRRQLMETTEARKIMDKSSSVPIQNLVGIEKVIEKLGKGIALNPEDLQMILGLLHSTGKIKHFMEERQYLAPTISSYGLSMYELKDVMDEIARCIVNNRVDDKASPQLEKIRKKVYIAENRIKTKLDDILKSPTYRKYLQETYVSTRQGRQVIAVKSEYRHQVSGSVIDKSSTGSTLFIEPEAVRKLQSELELQKIDEEKEEYQIRLYLTYMIESYTREININVETMAYYDYIFAKGKYSKAINGQTVGINTEGIINIHTGRHPMLGHEGVPLDFEIGNDYKALVITGPNTGGKTVALKTVGLFTAMVQSGLHVPVEASSEFAVFSDILVDIGDGQSIEQSLSTFSAHVTNMTKIINLANKYTLVILDELGAGTDPAEGEGLAVAILEELYKKGATIIATSHYSKVKTFASDYEGFKNGRMAFDINTLKPMYALVIGEAGESNAFIIALRLGIEREVIERAHQITYHEKKDYVPLTEAHKKPIIKTKPKIQRPKPIRQEPEPVTKDDKTEEEHTYEIGDMVYVNTIKQRGIVYAPLNKKGEVGVKVRDKKMLVVSKRLSPFINRKELYPDDYDMDIVLETKENRKKKHAMGRKYVKDMERVIE